MLPHDRIPYQPVAGRPSRALEAVRARPGALVWTGKQILDWHRAVSAPG